VLQFALYGGSLEAYGPRGRLDDSQLAWVWAGVRVEFQRSPNRHSYEWRIDVGYLPQGRVPLLPGAEFGLDVALCDRDADGSFSWVAWGPGTRKVAYPERMGTALLLARGADPQEAVERFLERSLSSTTTGGDVRVQQVRTSTSYQMFLTGALLTFTVLHLLLYLFYPSGRTNLYYALFTGLTAGAIFSGFQVDFSTVQLSLSPDSYTNFFTLGLYLTVLLVILFGLLFLYSLFYPRLPRRFWVFAVGLGGTAVFMGLVLMGWATFSQEILPVPLLFIAAALAETVRVVFRAIRQKKDGAWTVGMGFLAFGLAVLYLIVVNSSQSEVSLSAILGAFFPLVSMSVYLARNFARVNRDLQSQLGQVQQLSTRTHEQNRALERANQQIQEQNRQIQQANRLKSEFLARMSHDLRTPMNAIIGYTRILLRKTQDVLDERQYRNLANIRISADQLLALINDILDLSRIEAGRFEVRLEQVDLRHLAAECAEAMAPLLRSEVELRQLLEPVPSLRTDPDRLRRVLTNLLGNAAKFTEQGSITLSVRPADSGVELVVADTGVGIPAEELPYIFDEFRQVARKGSTAQEGTGLGLAIVKKYVDLLGGRIAVESTVAQGTRFVLRLRDYPATKAP
jgi:signal transduction histidine kinase